MRKSINIFCSFLLGGLLLTACGDKTEELKYANLTVEQNKVKIQDDGLATMEKLEGMSDMGSIHALADLTMLLNGRYVEEDPMYYALSDVLAPIVGVQKNAKSLIGLRAAAAEFDTLTNLMDEYSGVYTYNPLIEDFDFVPGSNNITVNYPIGTSSTNNGKLVIKNLTVKNIEQDEMPAELPLTLKVELTKNNLPLFTFDWLASYDADGVPQSWSTSLEFVEGYSFTQSLVNTDAKISWEFSYTLDAGNILSGKFTTEGDFTYETMANSDALDEDDWADQVIDNANAFVQMGNLKVTGIVDFNKMKAAMDKEFPNGQQGLKTEIDKSCVILNQHVHLVVMYADEGTAIATSDFYTKEYTESYFDYETYEYIESSYYDPGLRFKFKDGSLYDETFFDEGFDDLRTAFEEMQIAFQTNYAE